MKECDCIVLGTTLGNRRSFFFRTLESINERDTDKLLSKRLISIDDFGGGLPDGYKEFFSSLNFDYFIEKRRGMVKSLRQALDKVNTEWVLYCEDDLTLRWLPTKEEFSKIKSIKSDGRDCGVMGLSVGGYNDRVYSKEVDLLLNDKSNYIPISNEWYAMKRFGQYRNKFFIDFPATFMRTDLLKACIDKTIADGHKREIEWGITEAWFDLGLHKQFHKVSLLKNPWLTDENFHMNLQIYTDKLMPIILREKLMIKGGHWFGDSFDS